MGDHLSKRNHLPRRASPTQKGPPIPGGPPTQEEPPTQRDHLLRRTKIFLAIIEIYTGGNFYSPEFQETSPQKRKLPWAQDCPCQAPAAVRASAEHPWEWREGGEAARGVWRHRGETVEPNLWKSLHRMHATPHQAHLCVSCPIRTGKLRAVSPVVLSSVLGGTRVCQGRSQHGQGPHPKTWSQAALGGRGSPRFCSNFCNR